MSARNSGLARIPIGQLTDEELQCRCQAILRACHQRGNHLDVPAELIEPLEECYREANNRGMTDGIDLSRILRKDDPVPTVHPRAIIRYLREPYLSDFLRGVISFAPASVYKNDPDFARRDDEHARPYMVPDQIVVFNGGSYPTTRIRMRHNIVAADHQPLPYHFASFSAEQSLKMQRAFTADGAVLITNPKAFADLVWRALSREQPHTSLQLARVKYYDPMAGAAALKKPNQTLWMKPVEFAWHREARLVIMGGEPGDKRVNIEIDPPNGLLSLVTF
ncbi:MAG: hypothetical protein ACJ8NS_03110 [Chthoniobacterales bacterium]